MLCSASGCNAPGAHPRSWLPRTVDECTFPRVPRFSKPRVSCSRHRANAMLSSVTAAGTLTLPRASRCQVPWFSGLSQLRQPTSTRGGRRYSNPCFRGKEAEARGG